MQLSSTKRVAYMTGGTHLSTRHRYAPLGRFPDDVVYFAGVPFLGPALLPVDAGRTAAAVRGAGGFFGAPPLLSPITISIPAGARTQQPVKVKDVNHSIISTCCSQGPGRERVGSALKYPSHFLNSAEDPRHPTQHVNQVIVGWPTNCPNLSHSAGQPQPSFQHVHQNQVRLALGSLDLFP